MVTSGLAFSADIAGEGITLADGNTYHTGDLKPTWVEVENKLKIKIEDKYQGNSANNEFDYWKERLNEVDFVSGTAVKLTEYGEAGSLALRDTLAAEKNLCIELILVTDDGHVRYTAGLAERFEPSEEGTYVYEAIIA